MDLDFWVSESFDWNDTSKQTLSELRFFTGDICCVVISL